MEEKEESNQDPTIGKEDQNLVKNFDSRKSSLSPKLIGILLVLIILGFGLGFVLGNRGGTPGLSGGGGANNTSVSKGSIIGSDDTQTFKDTAEGTLRIGGIEGEGQFHLERSGGESQYVYMTSSVVDLSTLVGKKVKVWGQTQTAQHAGWLMDVGRVEVK